MENQYTYNLSKNLEYSKDGQFEATAEITFNASGMESFDESSEFSQLLMGAMIDASTESVSTEQREEAKKTADEHKKQEAPEPSEIRMMIFAGQKVKVKDIAASFKKLALKTGYLGSGIPLKADHINSLTQEDFIDMLCGYASFFTFPSLLREG